MTTPAKVWTLEQLCERHPAIKWAAPVEIDWPGGPRRWGCRVCIANHGLNGWEIDQLFRSWAAAAAHVDEVHGRRV